MKEITPFIYSSLYAKRFDTFEKYQNVFSQWIFGTLFKEPPIQYQIMEIPKDPLIREPIQEIPKVPPSPSPPIQEIPKVPSPSPPPPRPVRETPKKSPLFAPKKPDSLFWSIFIGQYGLAEYFTIENKFLNRELEEKTALIRHIEALPQNAETKHRLKTLGITIKDLKEILGDLMTNKTTSLGVLVAFVLYYKRSILVVSEATKSFYRISWRTDEEEDVALPILVYKDGKKYQVHQEPTPEMIQTIETSYFPIQKPEKPMKAISGYKSADLANIVAKSGYQIDLSLKKQDLYVAIYRHLDSSWNT